MPRAYVRTRKTASDRRIGSPDRIAGSPDRRMRLYACVDACRGVRFDPSGGRVGVVICSLTIGVWRPRKRGVVQTQSTHIKINVLANVFRLPLRAAHCSHFIERSENYV